MKIDLVILPNLANNPHFEASPELLHYRDFGPSYARPGDAGMDLRACIDEPVILHANQSQLIPTGLSAWIGSINVDTDYMSDEDYTLMAAIVPRSGLGSKQGLVVGNLVGVCDENYQGEIFICAWNRTDTSYKINPGDRIAQMIYVPVFRPEFNIVKSHAVPTERGEGCFGSTGVL
jgi:dUTP pyrophosphatase